MLSVPQIFFCRLDVSTKVSILFPFLRIGHVIECRFFFELEKTIKRFLADFAGVYGREYRVTEHLSGGLLPPASTNSS